MRLLTLLLLAVSLYTCEDTVEVPSAFEQPQLVVEAWLTDQSQPQVITLTLSQDYYGQDDLPQRVEGASVVVCRDSTLTDCLVFTEEEPGRHVWTPAPGERLGVPDQTFILGVEVDGERYAATSTMQRVPPIDSISFYFEEEGLGNEEGYYAAFYARDPVGRGDAYLIRTYFNDTLLLRPFELSLAYDATFSPGADADGLTFISPIRGSINPIDENFSARPLVTGDSIRVELWSLTDEAFLFLTVAGEQVQNGGIFATPLANAPGNILNVGAGTQVLGFFNVAAVSTAHRTFQEP